MFIDSISFTVPHSESLGNKSRHLLHATREEIIRYLIASHRRFTYQHIPNIEQSFLGLIKLSPNSPRLKTLFNLFLKFQTDLELHAQLEEEVLYKAFLSNSEKKYMHNFSHEEEEPYLTEIISLLERHTEEHTAFYQVLLTQLKNFNAELKEHAWLEENLVCGRMRAK